MPIGLTPGHLSKAMSHHATNAHNPIGSTWRVQIRLANETRTPKYFIILLSPSKTGIWNLCGRSLMVVVVVGAGSFC